MCVHAYTLTYAFDLVKEPGRRSSFLKWAMGKRKKSAISDMQEGGQTNYRS